MADEINGFEGLFWDGTVLFPDESEATDGAESENIENPVNVVVNQAGIDVGGELQSSTDQSDNQPGIIDKVAAFLKGGLNTETQTYLVVDPFGLPADPAPHEDTWADPDELTEQQKNDGLTIGIDPLGGTWIVNSNDDPIPEEIDRFNRKLEYIDGYARALGKTFVYDPNASFEQNLHKALELGGFAPGVGATADLANAVVYLSEGNYKEAGYSAIAAVPLAGDAFAAGRITNKAGKVVDGLSKAAEEVAGSSIKFTQTTASVRFSRNGTFSGKTIGELANDLRTGVLKSTDVPVEYIERDSVKLVVNTRSSLVLRRAGIPETEWNLVNKTGDAFTESKVTERLARNELTEEGTDAIRVTGSGKNVSSLE
ncbi:MAG: hypothetical protein H6Q66_266 [Firmicutes bacterium]|nr:hypothetical protein [Bacillota bacterium]